MKRGAFALPYARTKKAPFIFMKKQDHVGVIFFIFLKRNKYIFYIICHARRRQLLRWPAPAAVPGAVPAARGPGGDAGRGHGLHGRGHGRAGAGDAPQAARGQDGRGSGAQAGHHRQLRQDTREI